jgi:hypothetical protein
MLGTQVRPEVRVQADLYAHLVRHPAAPSRKLLTGCSQALFDQPMIQQYIVPAESIVNDAAYPESVVTKEEILAKVAAGEIPVEEASKLLEKAEQAKKGSLYCKVSAKGAISVYGLQRMPVTLYVGQWERLLDFADVLRQFMKEHDTELKRKEK